MFKLEVNLKAILQRLYISQINKDVVYERCCLQFEKFVSENYVDPETLRERIVISVGWHSIASDSIDSFAPLKFVDNSFTADGSRLSLRLRCRIDAEVTRHLFSRDVSQKSLVALRAVVNFVSLFSS